MATTVFTDGTNFTGAVGKFYDKKLIEQLVPKTVLYDFAEKRPIPLNMGNVAYFYKISEFTTTMGTVTEGTTPSAQELSASQKSVTLKQKFAYHQVSDIVDMTAINPVVTSAMEPISNRAALTVDKEILWRLTGTAEGKSLEAIDPSNPNGTTDVALSNILDGQQGGLSTLYISADGTRAAATTTALFSALSALGASAALTYLQGLKISARTIRAVVSKLWRNNAQPADGQLFDGIVAPEILASLMGDEDFIRWNQFNSADKGAKNYLGEFAGVKFAVSQSLFPVAGNTVKLSVGSMSAAGAVSPFSAYISLIFGKGCFAVSELTGKGGVKVIVKTPGPNDTSNPGDLYSTIGAKVTMAATVLEPKKGYFLFSTSF
jgi:N4-gp56 family major capsid protein